MERICKACELTEEEVSFTIADETNECECCDDCYKESQDYLETIRLRN